MMNNHKNTIDKFNINIGRNFCLKALRIFSKLRSLYYDVH